MPKEVIHDDATLYDVVVGWESEKFVQVGIQTHNGQPFAKVLGEDETGYERVPAMANFAGLWGTFDRGGINRLIRALRRARDQAYGKDE